MFSTRRCAQMGVFSAALVLLASLTLLIQGRHTVLRPQQSAHLPALNELNSQVVYNPQSADFAR